VATRAYVDSSCVVAIAFGEPGARRMATAARRYDRLVAANLLEAEVRSAGARERTSASSDLFGAIGWIHPDRALGAEMERALAHGQLRGADLWHVACALYLDPSASELAFLTLDASQRQVARALGLHAP
jgi:hypothetical protein